MLYDNFKLGKFWANENFGKNAIYELGFFIINTWGFYLIFKGKLEITALVTFNTLLGLFLDPIKNCIDSLPKYNFVKATFSKINDFLSLNKETLGQKEKLSNNKIIIKNLSFSYDSLKSTFNHFNLFIKPGEFVSLKGRSGSGKSTLCKILDKYITNYKGEIIIGNRNIKDLSIATIRENITYVGQNEALISGSIKENILLDREIDSKRFTQICNICGIEQIVFKKALRYETSINNDSTNISGGEAQRIILARAILNDFEILILDEALSEVDYQTERKIIKNLKHYFPSKTIIYITHKNHDQLFDRVIELGG